MKEKARILNDAIRASQVYLITDDGEVLGEMSLKEAKIKAREAELDLMEMGKKEKLTIVKMLDYGKFLYRQKKQEQKNKQKGKAPELKTLRITFKIGDNDLLIRKKQAEKFANANHPLRVTLMLRGRENHYENIAREKMEQFISMLEEFYRVDSPIKKSGNTFSAMLKTKK